MKKIKKYLKSKYSKEQLLRMHHFITRNKVVGFFIALFFGRNLTSLAQIYNTDKWGAHFYTPHYQHHFSKYRNKRINMLEIGVGGYSNPKLGGESLRMWKKYFPHGNIFSLDIHDKSYHQEARIKIFKGSQVDYKFLDDVLENIGAPLDIIIDDGSHYNEHVIKTFEYLFPKLKDGGIYVVEDIQTSYWESEGGDSYDLNKPDTIMNFFKRLTDCLNYKEFMIPGYQPSYYDLNIISVHFYHNMIFIYKGKNIEESNSLLNNQKRIKKSKSLTQVN